MQDPWGFPSPSWSGARRAIQFLNFIDALPAFEIVPFDPAAISDAGLVVKKFADQKLTLAEAHGIAIMRKPRMKFCWSSERRLALRGAALAIQ